MGRPRRRLRPLAPAEAEVAPPPAIGGATGERLRPGDVVRLVSPAGTPDRDRLERGVRLLQGWGLDVQLGKHVFDTFGSYLAGPDDDRLCDLNDALRDPTVRAVFATRGGYGSYRIADRIDVDAVRADPKPLVGFSDVTILHLAIWKQCRVAGFHAPFIGCWDDDWYGAESAEALRRALLTVDDVVLHRDPAEPTSSLAVPGRAAGVLLGGNLDLLASSVGWCCPSFDRAILLLESIGSDDGTARADRALTQLVASGALDGVRGVAVGQFTGHDAGVASGWTVVDVLEDRLAGLGVPVCGGFPVGHGRGARTVPLGTPAVLDVSAGTLRVGAGVR